MNTSTIESNEFLNQDIRGFFHTSFYGYGHADNPDFLNILKYDSHHSWTSYKLNNAKDRLKKILAVDLPQILETLRLDTLTVSVVPRSKADGTYRSNQMLFKSTVQAIANELNGFKDGSNYITRHTNTKTTHLRRPTDDVNDGELPYPGITTDTCNISNNARGKDILLIDDIYTRTVNIDEDAIQAMLNNGARSVSFYAVGYTVRN